MTVEQRKRAKSFAKWTFIVGPLIALMSWGFRTYDATNVSQAAYAVDSTNVHNALSTLEEHIEKDHVVLDRMDRKQTAMCYETMPRDKWNLCAGN